MAYDSKQYYQQPTATAAAVAAAAQPQPSVAETYYQTGGLYEHKQDQLLKCMFGVF